MATPQGFACLTITQAQSSKLFTHSHAASASARLLYDSALPCRCAAVTNVPGSGDGSRYSAALWCGFSP